MKKTKEELIARLIMSTGRKIRPFDIVQIADDIDALSNIVGGLDEVSRLIGKSTDVLRQFLSVKKLPASIIELVKNRIIDKLQDVRYLNQFNSLDQKTLVREIISGNLNTQDLKALSPLRKNKRNIEISKLLSQLKSSKDKKVYLFYFDISDKAKVANVKEKIQELIGKENIVSFEVENKVCTLTINEIGLKKIRSIAKSKGLTLKKYFTEVIK